MPTKAILCVDDEQIVLRSLQSQILTHFGDDYLCEVAESAAEAMELLEELQADGVEVLMIVSDWLMPRVQGDEFLIQVHQTFPNIVTVLLTGRADDHAICRAQAQANLFQYLRKPWDETTLVTLLQSGLESLNA